MLRVEHMVEREVDIALGVLGKRGVKQRIRPLIVLAQVGQLGHAVEEVTRCLHRVLEVDITAVRIPLRVVGIAARVRPVEDKVVLIRRTQRRGLLDEVVAETVRHPRQVDIRYIHQVKRVRPPRPRLARHGIVQTGIGQRTRVLIRPLLVVVSDVDLQLAGELQSCLGACLDSTAAVGAPLIRAASVQREQLSAAEDVLVGIPHPNSYAPVACRIGTFHLGGDGMQLGAGDRYVAVQLRTVHRLKRYIHILDRSQRVEIGVRALQSPLREHLARLDGRTVAQHSVAQKLSAYIREHIAFLAAVGVQYQSFRHPRGVVVGMEAHTAYRLLGVYLLLHRIGYDTLIVRQMHLQLERMVVIRAVGGVGQQ